MAFGHDKKACGTAPPGQVDVAGRSHMASVHLAINQRQGSAPLPARERKLVLMNGEMRRAQPGDDGSRRAAM
jgi:hypothetical protein